MCPFADMAWWRGNGIHLLARNSSTVRYQLCTVYSSVERVSKRIRVSLMYNTLSTRGYQMYWYPDLGYLFVCESPTMTSEPFSIPFKMLIPKMMAVKRCKQLWVLKVLVLGKVYVASGNIQRFGVPFFPRGTASKVQWVVLGFGLFFFKIKRSHKPFLFLLSQILECVDVSSFCIWWSSWCFFILWLIF